MRRDYVNLRQGDVLVSTDVAKTDWEHSLVLTADCDLWNDKFGKFLTVIPVVSAVDYIESIYFPEQCNFEVEKICRRFCDLPGYVIDEDFFYQYILDTHVDKLKKKYIGVGNIDVMGILQKYRSKHLTPRQAFQAVCDLKKIKWDSKIKQSLANMRGEYFFLNDLPGVSGLGFVALLRLPQSFSVDQVALGRDREVNSQEDVVYRSGSLSDALRYAVAQSFANVFSRIGLATSFESDRSEIIGMICDAYMVA